MIVKTVKVTFPWSRSPKSPRLRKLIFMFFGSFLFQSWLVTSYFRPIALSTLAKSSLKRLMRLLTAGCLGGRYTMNSLNLSLHNSIAQYTWIRSWRDRYRWARLDAIVIMVIFIFCATHDVSAIPLSSFTINQPQSNVNLHRSFDVYETKRETSFVFRHVKFSFFQISISLSFSLSLIIWPSSQIHRRNL